MIHKVFCFFGLHVYKTYVWAKLGNRKWTDQICIHCEYNKTRKCFPCNCDKGW